MWQIKPAHLAFGCTIIYLYNLLLISYVAHCYQYSESFAAVAGVRVTVGVLNTLQHSTCLVLVLTSAVQLPYGEDCVQVSAKTYITA